MERRKSGQKDLCGRLEIGAGVTENFEMPDMGAENELMSSVRVVYTYNI